MMQLSSELVRKTVWLLRGYSRIPADDDLQQIREWRLEAGQVVGHLVERLAVTENVELADWIAMALLLIKDFDQELDDRLADSEEGRSHAETSQP